MFHPRMTTDAMVKAYNKVGDVMVLSQYGRTFGYILKARILQATANAQGTLDEDWIEPGYVT